MTKSPRSPQLQARRNESSANHRQQSALPEGLLEPKNSGQKLRPWPPERREKRRIFDASPPDSERVERALQSALNAAKTGEASTIPMLVRPVDLEGLAPEVLRLPLDELMTARHADLGLDALLASGFLDSLLPEVEALVGFGDGEWRHKDVWKHTKQVVIQSVPKLEVRWSALFHDIGKTRTRSVSPNGEVHFFGHAEVGARMFNKMERRQPLCAADQSLQDEIHFLVLHHLRAACYSPTWTDSAVRRFAREMGPHMQDLLSLSRADITTKRPEKKRKGLNLIHQLAERALILQVEDAKVAPLPKGLGAALIEEFALPPSQLIGQIRRALEAACDAGELQAGEDIAYYVRVVARDPHRFGIES